MKVAVLASPEEGQVLLDVLGELAEAGLEAYGLKLRETWQGLRRSELFARILKADRYLAVLGPGSSASSWLPFAVGLALGRNQGIALYRIDSNRPYPSYLEGLPVIDGKDELIAFYLSERAEWLVREERLSARSTLLEMGISYHADSLAQCVRDGDAKAVELFLKAGFVPDAADRHGVPLLCAAARSRHLAVVQLLLERGARLDRQSEDRGYSPLMDATLAGAIEIVELLLARGADPDLQSKDGQTALVVAVGRSDVAAAKLLLEHGADPDIPDKLGLSARRYASLFKVPAMVELFGQAADAAAGGR